MDINCKNFEECLPIVSNAIEEATFIAIDTEFTGLDDGSHITGLDTPEKRYFKLLKPAKDYLIIQFGLSIFKKMPGHSKYEVKSFNFSIFPRTTKFTQNVTLKFQGPSLEFVTYQGLDFDEVIKKGVSYLSTESERRIREELSEKHSARIRESHSAELNEDMTSPPPTPSIVVPHWMKDFVDKQIKHVESAMSARNCQTIKLDDCDLLSKLVLFEQLNSRFPNRLLLEADSSSGLDKIVVTVTFVDDDDHKRQVLMRRHEEEMEELHKVLGFTKVVKLLHESKKLIVGHNMLFDVMHTINQFWSNLPRDYKSFKSLACQIFPRLLDTRHMASTEPFKGLIKSGELHKLHEELSALKKTAAPNIQIADDCCRRESRNPNFSNSAFSAYKSGVCFLLMKSHLGTLQKNISVDEKIGSYENRLHLENIDDVPFINLRGEDLPQSREDMYHFKLKKNKCLASAINILSNQGRFRLLDESSALVRIRDDDKLAAVKKSLSSLKEGSYKLQPFKEWLLRIDQGPHHAQGVSVLRESPPNLKRKHDDDNRTLSKKVPAKRKQRHSTDGVITPKKNGGVTDPLAMFHFEPEKTEGTQKPLLFDVPDEWD